MRISFGLEGPAIALANPRFRLYVLASLPSLLGTWIQRVAVGWLAWELTGSGAWLGMIALADMLPVMIFTPVAGAFADRLDRLVISRLLQYLSSAQAFVLAGLILTDLITIELLVGLTFVQGILQAIFHPFRQSLVANMVEESELLPAIAVNSMMYHAARFVGPALAGLAIVAAGAGTAIAVNCASYIPFLIALHRIKVPHKLADGAKKSLREIPREIGEGVRLAVAHPAIGPMFVILVSMSTAGRAAAELLPGFAGAVFDRDAMGLAWLTSAGGLGAMLGALVAAQKAEPHGLPGRIITMGLLLVLSLAGFVATTSFPIALVCFAASSFALSTGGVGTQTIVQFAVPENFRGRVLGLFGLMWLGCPAIGTLIIGAVSDWVGLRISLGAAIALPALAWLWALGRRRAIENALRERLS